MALSEQDKDRLAKELARKKIVMGEAGFQSYLGKMEAAIPQAVQKRNTAITETTSGTQQTPGFLGKVSRFLGVDSLARGAAAGLNASNEQSIRNNAISQTSQTQANLLAAIKDARQRGDTRAVANLEQELQRNINESQAFMAGAQNRADLGVSNRDVIGSAIRTAGTIASAGTFGGGTSGVLSKVSAPSLTTANTVGRGVVEGSLAGLKAGAATGAVFGGVSGVASGIEQGKGVLGTAFEAAKQGLVGGVTGGAFGAIAGGVGGGIQAKVNRKSELAELLKQGNTVDEALTTPLSKVADDVAPVATKPVEPVVKSKQPLKATAGYRLEAGKVVEDKPAQNLLKQGIDDTNVSIIQSFSAKDKEAAKQMVQIAKEVSSTGIPTKRPQEIVGQTFMQRAKDVEALNRTAGGQIDDIARTQLAGKPVNAGKATDQFFNQLERDGVDIDALRLATTKEELTQAFEGSAYEGLDTVQRTLKTVVKRVDPQLDGAKMDGLALHRAKRFIDNQVTYGKNAEGLVGDAERLLKGLRSSIDDVLDTSFPDYNTANTQYRETIEALDEMRRLIGRDFLGSGDIANLRAGEVMNRLLGNASAKPLSALQNLEAVSTKYGNKYNDSIIKQITFADLLDDVYQTTPTRGFAGGVQKGVEGAATGFLQRMRQGGVISAGIDTGAEMIQSARGITPEKAQAAIEAYLGLST